MNSLYGTLNELLVRLFNSILLIEELALKDGEFNDLTITEIHVIEAIGLDRRNMSSVARDLDITIGTLTISINNLLHKGYVDRNRSDEDRRIVLISLTEKGMKVYKHHADFHDEMIKTTISKLSDQEMEVLVSALGNINSYFKVKYSFTRKSKNKEEVKAESKDTDSTIQQD